MSTQRLTSLNVCIAMVDATLNHSSFIWS